MRLADAIVIGGGPGGSSCAWKLREAGLDVLLLDKAAFPRTKLCAGWVTPEALADLEIDPDDCPIGILRFEELNIHWRAITVRPRSRQYSVRRLQFDDFLLHRAGVTVLRHKASRIRRDGGDYVVDDEFRCRYLIGAGGTACPVYRAFFEDRSPRNRNLQTATYEQEFAYDWEDPACHLWFFDGGLPGYAWYVPKANGYINVGLGGMAVQMKRRGGHIRGYWSEFVTKLSRMGLVSVKHYDPAGYSYFLRGATGPVQDRNAYIVGDAAGLATRDMCEGIGPAVKSGLLAARSITIGEDYSTAAIGQLSGSGFFSNMLARKFARA